MDPRRYLVSLSLMAAVVGCSGGSDVVDPGADGDTYQYPAGKVFFSYLPVGLDGVFFFESMGALYTPFQEDHGAFFHIETDPAENTIPVIAPADGQVTEIRTGTGHDGTIEHAVRFQVSTTIELLWGHVGRLAEPLAGQAPPLGTGRDVAIPVVAGDTLGFVANTPLDLAVNDSTNEARILHPEFHGPNPHAAPLEDYYQEPLKSQLLDLTVREVQPRTGIMGYDVAGTLAGIWYLEGTDPTGPEIPEDKVFHFGYHHIQAQRSTVIDGSAYVLTGTGEFLTWSFWIKGNPRVEEITPSSGLVKFEMYQSRWGVIWTPPNPELRDISGLDDEVETTTVLLVEMLDNETVRVERFDAPGISAQDVAGFTANAMTYKRDPVGSSAATACPGGCNR